MKKVFSLVLAGLLVAGMAVSTSAAFQAEEDLQNISFDIHRINGTWTPDGEWSDGEYAPVDVQNTWISAATNDEANLDAAKNLDFKLGMSYDDQYVYGYVQFVDANGHDNAWDDEPGSMWYSGALQINFSDADEAGDQRLEYGIGLTNNGKKITNTWGDYLGGGFESADADWTCDVDGDTVTYEFRTPFSAFSDSVKGKEGDQIGFCLVISWGNEQDYIHTQLASGCTGDPGKAADNYAKVTLGDQIVVETEPETVETVADTAAAETTEAPKTFDAGIIAAVAAIVSAAGYAISKKH